MKRKRWWSKYQQQVAALLCGLCLLSCSSFVWAVGQASIHSPSPSGKPTVSHKVQALRPPAQAKRLKSQHRRPVGNAVGALEIIDIDVPGLRGNASFYGKRFNGRKTATGERFDSKLFTGASNRFPLGSRVAVRRLDNERCAIVKINDRMHVKHRQRVIDVSLAVAEYLDMVRAGVMLVRVTAVNSDASEDAQGDCHEAIEPETPCLSCDHGNNGWLYGQPEKSPDFWQALPPQD